MKKILIAGGFTDEADGRIRREQIEFANLLGREVIQQGHTLLNAGMTDFDAEVSNGAFEACKERNLLPENHIKCYVLTGQNPTHRYGDIKKSKLSDWTLTGNDLYVPEPIQLADVVILLGGFDRTNEAANWARLVRKPLLPVTRFGGAAERIYFSELNEFVKKYSAIIKQDDYETLASYGYDVKTHVYKIIGLSELISTPKSVFVIMSFRKSPQLDDAFESFKEVCKEYSYDCSRMDKHFVQHVIPEMLKNIENCAFTIIDLSEPSHNVYFELGYAHGLRKNFIITAKEGTELPFDVRDLQVLFYDGQRTLKDGLRNRIASIAKNQGRI